MIDGFLDISIPMDEDEDSGSGLGVSMSPSSSKSQGHLGRNQRTKDQRGDSKNAKSRRKEGKQKYLFTVKRGGIAGYLGLFYSYMSVREMTDTVNIASLSGFASYVDIRAKTDTYVGFLPSNAMERLLEKRPIVLLTLSKRLLSLLSPLGKEAAFWSLN